MSRRILVTAGASGIGREFVRAFSALGDVVFVCDTDCVPDQAMLDVCHQVAQECRVTPSRKHHLVIDARFKDQLIVYGDTRGYGHGSDVG